MRFVVILILCSFLATPAIAESSKVKPLSFTKQEEADLERIESYLNNLKSISADFLQVDDYGGMLRGTIAMQRPGKMRVNYAPPSKDFIIADGDFVHIWNDELKEQTNVPQGSSLAEFILRDPVKLSGDVVITKFKRFPAKLEVSLKETEDPAAGELTLVFEDQPLKLRQWKVLDPQGHTTGVNLENVREGIAFPKETFRFIAPNFGKNNKIKTP
ncbi:MAG: outer-membrane lipoprotein carrier protein LolA [Alphaproteobacteria bacterium]